MIKPDVAAINECSFQVETSSLLKPQPTRIQYAMLWTLRLNLFCDMALIREPCLKRLRLTTSYGRLKFRDLLQGG
jgi:hypothetical protein